MLTHFFDGVPPLPGEADGSGLPNANALETAGSSQTGGWYVHKPLSNCTECHGSRQRQGFSRQVRLVANVPKLCYTCHEGYAKLEGWVHGPVAVGECLLCHEPHKSRNESLLVKPAPDLCYGCHEVQAIRLIEGHAEASYARCNDCHEGHAAATKSLLKPGRTSSSETSRQVVALSQVQASEYPGGPDDAASPAEAQERPAAAVRTRPDEREERQPTPADRYSSSVEAYHAGRFAEAREGFLEVLKNHFLPQSMREMAKDYLEKIEWLQKGSRLPGWGPAR